MLFGTYYEVVKNIFCIVIMCGRSRGPGLFLKLQVYSLSGSYISIFFRTDKTNTQDSQR